MAKDLELNVLLKAIDKATGPLKKIDRASKGTADALKQTATRLNALERAQGDLDSFKKLKKAAQENTRAQAAETEKIRELTRAIKETDGPTKQLNRQRNAAIRRADELKRKTAGQNRELEELRRSIASARKGTESLSEMQRRLARETGQVTKQLDRQQAALSRVARRAQRLQHLKQARQTNFSRRSEMQGRLYETAAIGATVALPIAAAINFESTMADLNKVANLTPKELKAVRRQILAMSREMPMAADEIGAIMTAAAQSGIAKKEIADFTRSAIKMGIAFDIAGGDAGTLMAKWRTGMKLTQKQAVGLADAINYLSNHMAATAAEIADIEKRVGAYAKAAGIGERQTAALGASMVAAGAAPERAARAIKRMTVNLTAGKSATKTVKDALDALGMSSEKMAQRMQKDASGAILDLLERIKKLDAAKRPAILTQIFGANLVSAIAPLLGNLDQLKYALGAVADKSKTAGSMQKEYQSRVQTTANDLQLLKNQTIAVGVALGNKLLPTVSKVAGELGKFMNKVAELADRFPAATKAIVATVAALVALKVAAFAGGYAFLLLKGGVLTAITIMTKLRGALTLVAIGIRAIGVAIAANPIVIAIAAIAAAAYLIYKYWDPIKQFFVGLWDKVKAAFDGGIGSIAKLLVNWSPLGLIYKGIQAALGALGVELPAKFSDLGGMLIDGLIKGIKGAFGSLKQAVSNIGSSVIGWFKDKLGIHSPSRVFADLGRFTLQGYERGIARQQAGTLKQVDRFARRVRMAGAGLALGVASMPALAGGIGIDHRPPVRAGASARPAQINLGGIHIHAAPGMDERALAEYVAAEVQRALTQAQHDAAAERRSALYDTE